MGDVLFFQANIPQIGYPTRKPTKGPELALVRKFVKYKLNSFTEKKKASLNMAIFYEPSLETGFPDVVIAEYNRKAFDNWSDSRCSLDTNDLKVFLHIYLLRGADSATLQKQLGISSKLLLSALERLLDAGLIRRYARQWQALNIKSLVGINKLVAVEAKMSDWSSVFQQAQLNKWFSSESYILSPVVNPSEKILQRSEEVGVGIYLLNKSGLEKVKPSPVMPFPSCYGSLLFNEWIGRRLALMN